MKKNLLRALALSVVATSGMIGMSAHAADQAVVDALKASLEKASELGALYLQSIPFADETVRTAIEVTLPGAIANVNDIAEQFPDVASAEAYVNAEIAKIEEALLADIEAKVTAGDAFSFEYVQIAEAGLPPYFSTSVSAVDVTDSGLITTNEISAGNLFRAELQSDNTIALYTVNTNQQVTTNFYLGSGAYGVNIWGRHKTKPTFLFALKDGYVQLISQLEDKDFALAYNDEKGYATGIDKSDAKTLFKLQAYDLSTVADMAAEQITNWGALVPSGNNVAESANAEINSADNVASIGAIMEQAKKDMIANIAAAPVKIKSEATGLYVGYEDGWWANFEEGEAHDWTLTSAGNEKSYPDYYLFRDDNEGKYIGWSFGLQAVDTPNASVGSWNSSYFVIMLDNPANITLFKGANGSSNGMVVEDEKLTTINKMATRYIDGIENFSFSFEIKGLSIIDGVTVEEDSDTVIYDLMGRRVINPDRGFYIVNGKKVLIK